MIEGFDELNLIPNEILFFGSQIVARTSEALDREAVERTVGVRRARGVVSLSRDGTRITWAPGDTRPGWYELSVDELLSRSGKLVTPGGRIRFGLVSSAARIPKNVAVESMTRVRVERWRVTRLPLFAASPRGNYVEFMKASDRTSGAPVRLAFDETGAPIDADELVELTAVARARRFGKLDERLYLALRGAPDDQRFPVAVWARTDDDTEAGDKSPLRPLDDDALERLTVRREALVYRSVQLLSEEIRRVNGEGEPDELAPVVYSQLTKRAIRRLTRSERVAAIFRHDVRGIDDLDDSQAVAHSDDVHSTGSRGAGVRVAVWERGPDSTANLSIAGTFDATGATSSHSRLVHGVIKNTEARKPNGHAPDCALYSANSYDLAALRWAVRDERCTVVNQSFHRTEEQTSDSLSFDDVYKDWLVLHSPFPTLVHAAGNGSDTEFVNHKGFNSLTVANHNDDASALSGTSVFRSPSNSHADRELPEIAANGTGVSAVQLTNSGTSFASPAVAGIAALLQSREPILRSWPEGCRAILLAGATRNIMDSTWWQDVISGEDTSDGSGAVNALESDRIASSRSSRNAAASRRGWDIGTLSDEDFGADGYATFTYRVSVPDWILGPRHVKVSLAWNSKVTEFSLLGLTIPLSSQLQQDLDLKVYDASGNLVAHSQSWDNSYEIAEFNATQGNEYTIRIRRWSGTGWTWYGIAWTVTGGLLDLIRLQSIAFEDEQLLARLSP